MDINFIVGFRVAISTMDRGATLVFPNSMVAEDVLGSMIKHRVSHVYFSPFQARDIVDRAGFGGIACPDLVCLKIVGGYLRKELLQALTTKLSKNIHALYGSTESGMVTYATPEMLAVHPNTTGKVCEWASVEVVDSEDNLLSCGATGQLRIRSEHQVQGYYRDEERSRRYFRNEWFYPGDLGHFDAEGLLYIDGRMDEQINLGGTIINPEDIEAILAAHSEVIDAGVFVATEGAGYEFPAVALVLDDLAHMDAIQAYALAKLGPLAPVRYFTLPTLPRTATGKLKRNELTVLFSANSTSSTQ
jgi:acyl-coenzyme A synthetase/AMP-(fatty) acid ligase